jgi:hypothetical protein
MGCKTIPCVIVLFCLPFVAMLAVAGALAMILTPLVTMLTSTIWSQLLKGTKQCL